MNATRLRAVVMKWNLVGLVLLHLSGAEPAVECPAEPAYMAPERAPLAGGSCPSGSCQERRPC